MITGQIITISGLGDNSRKEKVIQSLANRVSAMGRTIVVDLDPQALSTKGFVASDSFSIQTIFEKKRDFPEVVQKTKLKNLFILPSNIDVARTVELDGVEERLTQISTYLKTKFDYIIIDTPPYINLILETSIKVADRVIISTQIESQTPYFLTKLLNKFAIESRKISILPIDYSEEKLIQYSEIVKKFDNYIIKQNSRRVVLNIDEIDKFNPLSLLNYRD